MATKCFVLVVSVLLLMPQAVSGEPAEKNLEKGKEALEAFQAKEALDFLNEAVRLDPKNAEAYHYRGLAYKALFELEKAIADQSEAIKLNPKLVKAYVARGMTHFVNSDSEKALADLTEAIKLEPKNPEAWAWRGLVHMESGQYAKAIADYQRQVELSHKDEAAYIQLARIYATCPDDKIRDGKKAVELATAACKQGNEASFYALEALAASHAELGKFDEAIKVQKQAIAAIPKELTPSVKSATRRLKQYEDHKPLRYRSVKGWTE